MGNAQKNTNKEFPMKNTKFGLEKRLNKRPQMKQRFEALLDIVEDADGDLDKADAAEERVIQELQQMGREAIEHWAKAKEEKQTEKYLENNKDIRKIKNKGKKKYIGIRPLEK